MTPFAQISVPTTTIRHHTERRTATTAHNARLPCNLFALRALLDDTDHPDWGTVETFDHRTLQRAHDLLAAVWRFRHDARQFELSLDVCHPRWSRPLVDREAPVKPHDLLAEVPGRWLDWLREEVDGWLHSPHLVRSVQRPLFGAVCRFARARRSMDRGAHPRDSHPPLASAERVTCYSSAETRSCRPAMRRSGTARRLVPGRRRHGRAPASRPSPPGPCRRALRSPGRWQRTVPRGRHRARCCGLSTSGER